MSLKNFDFTLVIVSNLHHMDHFSWLGKKIMKKKKRKIELSTNDYNAKSFNTLKALKKISREKNDPFLLLCLEFKGQ